MANSLAYFLIEADPVALKMIAAWPVIPAGLNEEGVLKAWSRITGQPISEIRRLAPVLWENEVCTMDGKVDPTIQKFLQARIALQLVRTKPTKS